MGKITQKQFYELKFGCPIYSCMWAADCKVTGRPCNRDDCPFVYWITALMKSQEPHINITIPKKSEEEWAIIKAGARMFDAQEKMKGDL